MEQITVRNTQLVDSACMRKHYYVWELGIRPKKTDPKLQVGTLVHKFLEFYEPLVHDVNRSAYAEALQMVDWEYINFKSVLREDDIEGRAKVDKCLDTAKRIIQNYAGWRVDESGLEPLIQAEAEFRVSLGAIHGTEVFLKGTMDGVAKDAEGELWLREYKTCANIADKMKQYTLDPQTRRYVTAMRTEGINIAGVELVLIAKIAPLEDNEFILTGKSTAGLITKDKKAWGKSHYDQALRVARLGKFASPDSSQGLTEEAFHGILRMLKGKGSPFVRMERLRFNDVELANTLQETIVAAGNIVQAQKLAGVMGDLAYPRQVGVMGMNCKNCAVRPVCEMDLKGIDTSLLLQEHYVVGQAEEVEAEEGDDEEDMGS